jgi:hypothetical protein
MHVPHTALLTAHRYTIESLTARFFTPNIYGRWQAGSEAINKVVKVNGLLLTDGMISVWA